MTAIILVVLAAGAIGAQAISHGLIGATGSIFDFRSSATTYPVAIYSTMPTGCLPSQLGYNSNTNQLMVCGTGNIWGLPVANVTSSYSLAYTAALSVTLAHNFNTMAVTFDCYDNSSPPLWILPKSVALTSLNAITVTFASAASGTCVVRN